MKTTHEMRFPAGWCSYTPSHSALPFLNQGKGTACSGRHCVKV